MRNRPIPIVVATIVASAAGVASAQSLEPAFTYQGVLRSGGQPVSGTYDIAFELFDAQMGGASLGTDCHDNVSVTDGLVTAEINFGEVLGDRPAWLEIRVRRDTTAGNCAATGGYTTLTPRQSLRPAPYALALPAMRTEMIGFLPNVIGGAQDNEVAPPGRAATISGGYNNLAAEEGATIGGGGSNRAEGRYSTVGGGAENNAAGRFATAPGGFVNTASGAYAFAAGHSARAQDDNTFVWSDGNSTPTTGPYQFLVWSRGGAAINATPRAANLTVASSDRWRWDVGNGWGDFSIGNETVGLAVGVATTGGGAGTARMWPKGGAEGLIIGTPTAGDVIAVSRDGRTHIGAGGDGITVTSDGRVGIGVTSPAATFLLSVNGQAGKPGGGSWAVFSDERLKQDIQPMSGTLDRLLTLRGYEFAYTQDAIERGLGAEGPQFGLLAGEVEEVFPEWVGEGPDGLKYISERAHTALLVEALRDLRAEKDAQIQRQQEQIESQQRELRRRQSEHETQQRQIDDLRNDLHALAKAFEAERASGDSRVKSEK
ncbi:MAG: tail fiber domain-containing protein [Phycisphaerales bacterium JB039]